MTTTTMGKQLAENKMNHDAKRPQRLVDFYHEAVSLAVSLRSQEVGYSDSLPAIFAAEALVTELEKLLPE